MNRIKDYAFPFLYFILTPIFFFKKEFIWSKFFLFSLSNIFFLFLIIINGKREGKFSYPLFIWAVFTIFSLISLIHSPDRYRSALTISIYLSLLIFLYVAEIISPDERISSIFLSLSSLIVALIGIMQKFGILMRPYYTKYGEIDISSTFGLSNFSAEYIAVAGAFSYSLLKQNKTLYPLTIAVVISGISYIILAQALAGFLGFISAALIYLFFCQRRNLLKTLPIIIGLSIFAFLFTPAKNFVKRGASIIKMEDAPSVFRIECWKSALKIFREHPIFGAGSGTFEVYVEKYGSEKLEALTDQLNVKTKRTHNDFLEVLSEGGLFGFFLFLLFFGLGVYNSLENKKGEYLPPMIAYSVISLFSFPVKIIPTAGAFFFSIYLSFRDRKVEKRRILQGILYSLFLLAIFISFAGYRVFMEECMRRQAIVKTLKGDLQQALFFINRAIETNPYESDLYFLRAQIYYKMRREFPSAVEDLKKFVKKNPYHGKAYYILSLLEYYLMRYKEAAEHMDMAYEYKKLKDKNFYFYAYKIYQSAGFEDKALKALILYESL